VIVWRVRESRVSLPHGRDESRQAQKGDESDDVGI
jgi:hypothetical protein